MSDKVNGVVFNLFALVTLSLELGLACGTVSENFLIGVLPVGVLLDSLLVRLICIWVFPELSNEGVIFVLLMLVKPEFLVNPL